MTITDFSGRVSGKARPGCLRSPLAAFVPGDAVTPLATDSAVLIPVRWTVPGLAFATCPQHPHKQNLQSMARIAVTGGVSSGPYPAWDPV